MPSLVLNAVHIHSTGSNFQKVLNAVCSARSILWLDCAESRDIAPADGTKVLEERGILLGAGSAFAFKQDSAVGAAVEEVDHVIDALNVARAEILLIGDKIGKYGKCHSKNSLLLQRRLFGYKFQVSSLAVGLDVFNFFPVRPKTRVSGRLHL